MVDFILMHGRAVERGVCDFCNKTIYMTDHRPDVDINKGPAMYYGYYKDNEFIGMLCDESVVKEEEYDDDGSAYFICLKQPCFYTEITESEIL